MLSNEQIDHLIAAREAITSLRNFDGLLPAVDNIDAVLDSGTVAGARNDVDLLLARENAVLNRYQALRENWRVAA